MPSRATLLRLLQRAATLSGLDRQPAFAGAEVPVIVVGPRRIAALNRAFLGHAGPTDVIAFALPPPVSGLPPEAGPRCAGELYVNPAAALAEAPRHGQSAAAELTLYIVHGLLHLAGHDDLAPAPRRRMRAAERRVMAGLRRDFDLDALWDWGGGEKQKAERRKQKAESRKRKDGKPRPSALVGCRRSGSSNPEL